jgi:hypothetical protein
MRDVKSDAGYEIQDTGYRMRDELACIQHPVSRIVSSRQRFDGWEKTTEGVLTC